MDLSQKEIDEMIFNDNLNLNEIERLAKALQKQETQKD